MPPVHPLVGAIIIVALWILMSVARLFGRMTESSYIAMTAICAVGVIWLLGLYYQVS